LQYHFFTNYNQLCHKNDLATLIDVTEAQLLVIRQEMWQLVIENENS